MCSHSKADTQSRDFAHGMFAFRLSKQFPQTQETLDSFSPGTLLEGCFRPIRPRAEYACYIRQIRSCRDSSVPSDLLDLIPPLLPSETFFHLFYVLPSRIRAVDDNFVSVEVSRCKPKNIHLGLDSEILEQGFDTSSFFFDVGLIFNEDGDS